MSPLHIYVICIFIFAICSMIVMNYKINKHLKKVNAENMLNEITK